MFSQEMVVGIIDFFVKFATDLLMPMMVMVFLGALALRGLVYFTIVRQMWFCTEFEKRLHHFIDNREVKNKVFSFFISAKVLLEKTYYELFVVRAIMKRRNPDFIMAKSDRIFMIQQGCARIVNDTLRQIKYIKYGKERAKLLEVSKSVFDNNASFKKLFGVIPLNTLNDFLNILPGLFIVGGIFGTFLGIMKALPALGQMDLNDIVGANAIMNEFLLKISFSMSTSIIGIILSVSLNIFNTVFSPEKLYIQTVDKFENCLDIIWNVSSNNYLPNEIESFDENRDPIEVLAEDAVQKQIEEAKNKDLEKVKMTDIVKKVNGLRKYKVDTPTVPEHVDSVNSALPEEDIDEAPHFSTHTEEVSHEDVSADHTPDHDDDEDKKAS